jgi:hypothetical protein
MKSGENVIPSTSSTFDLTFLVNVLASSTPSTVSEHQFLRYHASSLHSSSRHPYHRLTPLPKMMTIDNSPDDKPSCDPVRILKNAPPTTVLLVIANGTKSSGAHPLSVERSDSDFSLCSFGADDSGSSSSSSSSHELDPQSASRPSSFAALRLNYLLVTLAIMLADGLQGT